MTETTSMLFNKRLIAFNAKVREKKYWTNKLSGSRKELFFPSCHADELSPDGSIETREFQLDAGLHARLAQICPSPGALFVVLTAALSVQLYKFMEETAITIGAVVEKGSEHEGSLNTAFPMVIDVEPASSFRGLLYTIKQTYVEAQANQDYPIDLLLKSLADDEAQLKPFNIGIALRNIHNAHTQALDSAPELSFNFEENSNGLACSIAYHTSVYHSNDIDRIFNSYQVLLRNCLANPDRKIKEIEALSHEEKQTILHELNATKVQYPSDASIPALFEAQVRSTPESIAVIYNDEQISYAELNTRANALAARLLSSGVKPQTNIAVFQLMDIDYIASILAILKVRCVYVPVSTQDPLARIAWLLDDIRAAIILTTKASIAESGIDAELLAGAIKSGENVHQETISRTLIFADDAALLNGKEFQAAEQPLHSDLAYIMFTSGSTGNPKGVMVSHRNVVRLVCNTNYVKLSAATRILLTGSPTFDATTFEIWGSLLNGGALNLVDRDILLDTERLYKELTRNSINTLWLTSAFFNQLVQQSKRNIFSGLSYLIVGGDALSPRHINIVRKDNPGLKIINGYGPTENTTFSLTMSIEKEYHNTIPIGRPINNSTAYVLDGELNIKPVSAWGILYVGGDGVSSGYLNSPGLSLEKFIQDPFGNGFLYRTDDVARVLPDLNIEFKGRIDDQVKVRGFRITLGEIEHQLCGHENVAESVVLVKEGEGDKYLVAYYVSPARIDAAALKEFLAAKLPVYMVPAHYVHLTAMPLTANGKINRKLLPDIQFGATAIYEAPADEVEEELAAIWAQLFQMDKASISVNANFFDLGGHSLKATTLMNNINRAFDTNILIKDIFAEPTIKGQASLIRMNEWANANKEYDNVEGIEIVI